MLAAVMSGFRWCMTQILLQVLYLHFHFYGYLISTCLSTQNRLTNKFMLLLFLFLSTIHSDNCFILLYWNLISILAIRVELKIKLKERSLRYVFCITSCLRILILLNLYDILDELFHLIT